jgi:hypothetical protein
MERLMGYVSLEEYQDLKGVTYSSYQLKPQRELCGRAM